jgi:RHS repeat-associated protein
MYDNIGSARGLLDASGTATDWYELDTFGRQVSSSGTTPNPYRFGGAWGYITDPSGFLQLGQRFYWPEVGRFAQRDPMPMSTNEYVYADNDPEGKTDATGLIVGCAGPRPKPPPPWDPCKGMTGIQGEECCDKEAKACVLKHPTFKGERGCDNCFKVCMAVCGAQPGGRCRVHTAERAFEVCMKAYEDFPGM